MGSTITKRKGKAASVSTEQPMGRQNTDHIKIIVLFSAGISRPEIHACLALAAVAAAGRQGWRTTIKVARNYTHHFP